MVPLWLLGAVVRVEAVALAMLVVGLLGHAALLSWREPRQSARRSAARRLLAAAATDATAMPGALASLASFPADEQRALVGGLAPLLAPSERASLHRMAADVGLIRRAERDCAHRDWGRRLRGAALLTAVGGGEAIVAGLLRDPNPLVRAQTAAWAADHRSVDVTAALIDGFADEGNEARFACGYALAQARGAALDQIVARCLAEERSATAVALAHAVRDVRCLPVALRGASDASAELRARSARLLGLLGGSEAASTLVELLGDPAPEVRLAAVAAIGRMGQWTTVAALIAALRDSNAHVRRATVAALRDLGPPAILLLRRAAAGSDPEAAEAARRALALEDVA